MLIHTCKCQHTKVEGERSGVQGKLQLHSNLEAILGYMRPCLNKTKIIMVIMIIICSYTRLVFLFFPSFLNAVGLLFKEFTIAYTLHVFHDHHQLA